MLQDKKMNADQHIKTISNWINNYARKSKCLTLVVGISGGIDSSVVSTLCAMTGLSTIVVSMPIKQRRDLHKLSLAHGQWLTERYDNVKHLTINLTPTFNKFAELFKDNENMLALANSRSRLRMTTLYQIAQSNNGLVVGTGNRVEDFGVGFFTKYGDGGVDISPIGDCSKTQVWAIGQRLELLKDIIDAVPTDGLWDDGRTDEQQLGMSYAELELAMQQDESNQRVIDAKPKQNLIKYREIRSRNLHKMQAIPVCTLKNARPDL